MARFDVRSGKRTAIRVGRRDALRDHRHSSLRGRQRAGRTLVSSGAPDEGRRVAWAHVLIRALLRRRSPGILRGPEIGAGADAEYGDVAALLSGGNGR